VHWNAYPTKSFPCVFGAAAKTAKPVAVTLPSSTVTADGT